MIKTHLTQEEQYAIIATQAVTTVTSVIISLFLIKSIIIFRDFTNQARFVTSQLMENRMNHIKELPNGEILRLSNEELNKLTKECLQEALIILMGQMPFESITITRLVEKAGVSRQAFYRNYSSKEDILNQMTKKMIENLHKTFRDPQNAKDPYSLFLRAFGLIKDNARICVLCIKANVFQKFMTDYYSTINSITPAVARYQFTASLNSFLSVSINWLINGMEEPVEYMAKLCMKLINTQPIEE